MAKHHYCYFFTKVNNFHEKSKKEFMAKHLLLQIKSEDIVFLYKKSPAKKAKKP